MWDAFFVVRKHRCPRKNGKWWKTDVTTGLQRSPETQ